MRMRMSEFVTEAGVPHFKVGQRKVYLPNHKIALVRTPFLPPTFAKFIVPLHFNKLDMRDYMWHVYGVRALTVRSFVEQQRVRAIDPDADIPRRKWHRPPAIKKMTIEMDKPFVWPEEPSDYSEWDKDSYDAKVREQEEHSLVEGENASYVPASDRSTIARQASRLLQERRS